MAEREHMRIVGEHIRTLRWLDMGENGGENGGFPLHTYTAWAVARYSCLRLIDRFPQNTAPVYCLMFDGIRGPASRRGARCWSQTVPWA